MQPSYLHSGGALKFESLGLSIFQVHLEYIRHAQKRIPLHSKKTRRVSSHVLGCSEPGCFSVPELAVVTIW